MDYHQRLNAIYCTMNACRYDPTAIYYLDHIWDKLNADGQLSSAQKRYLTAKIDSFTENYYNVIRSPAFFKLNNNLRTSSNYAKFFYQWYLRVPETKLKKMLLDKLKNDLRHRKDTYIFDDLRPILESYSVHL